MDAWILTKLENFWMKIDISPYEVSRFFIVGSVFSMVAGTALVFYKQNHPSIFGFMLVVWGRIIIREYKETKDCEKENGNNRINHFKYVDKMYRILLWVFCIGNMIVYFTERHFDGFDIFNFIFYFLLIAAYFKAINWIRPEPKRFVVMQPT